MSSQMVSSGQLTSSQTAPPVAANADASVVSSVKATSVAVSNTKEGSAAPLAPVQPPQPPPPPASFDRPALALSVHIMHLLKAINLKYCQQRRLEGPGQKFNGGYDDKEGHYVVLAGEEILQRYTVQEVLGKGSFGTVLKCFDEKRQETVAMKITRHGTNFRNQAKLEIDILLKLNNIPALNYLVVKLLKVFDWQGHLVLVFELLSFNLYQLIKCTKYSGVSLDLARKFAFQLVQVLHQLEAHKPPIIHCDLKPENILLRNQNRSGIRLIDFGSACYHSRRMFKYIQSRFYRSPEVILNLDYSTAIDRWSLGCVLVELHCGLPLFDGRTEAQQLAKFENVLGPLPSHMVANSPKKSRFYKEEIDPATNSYLLLEPITEPTKSLEQTIGVTTGGPRGLRKGQVGHDEENYRQFYDFVSKLLKYDPNERLTCADAFQHPFLLPLTQQEQQQQQANSNSAIPQIQPGTTSSSRQA